MSFHLFDHGYRIDVREADPVIHAGGRLVAVARAYDGDDPPDRGAPGGDGNGWHVHVHPSVTGQDPVIQVADHAQALATLAQYFPSITEVR
jgi:hypothetical protein